MAHPSLMSRFTVKCQFKALLCRICSHNPTRRCIVTSCSFQKQKGSSKQWLNRQLTDPFVIKAKQDNWRCRSAYKLLEIDDKCHLLKPGYIVIDCGAAPGSWTQVAVSKCSLTESDSEHDSESDSEPDTPIGKVIGVDLQPIQPIEGAVLFDKSDFTAPDTQARIIEELDGELADVVLSDMAPNASGTASLDHDVIIQLCLSVLHFCTVVLKSDGSVVCKIWMGSDQEKLKSVMDRMFRKVKYVKPEASRSDSAEVYLVGQGYRLRKT